jgi:hypothetical protein
MEPEGSFTCSEEPFNGHYHEPVETSSDLTFYPLKYMLMSTLIYA